MFSTSRTRRAAGSLALSGALLGACAVVAQPASAASASACQASALNLSVLGTAGAASSAANPANTPCITDHNGTGVSALSGVTANAIASDTATTRGVSASAEAKIVGLHADASSIASGLVAPLTSGSTSILPAVNAAVNAQLGVGGSLNAALAPLKLAGLTIGSSNTSTVNTDTSSALPAALTASLPDLVDSTLIDAQASAVCSNGVAVMTGHTTLTGVTVLGEPVDVNDAAGKVLSLDSETLNLGQLVSVDDLLKSITIQPGLLSGIVASALGSSAPTNLYDLLNSPSLLGVNGHLSGGATVSSVNAAVDAALSTSLNSTSIPLPTGLLQATITPNTSTLVSGSQTTTALSLSFSGLGQSLLSGYLAQASVSDGGADCAHPPVPVPTPTPKPTPTPNPQDGFNAAAVLQWKAGPAAAVLQCGGGMLRLIDVRQNGSKTYVKGVADSSLIGQTATIYSTYGNKKVGKATVDGDGIFATTVPLPAASIRATNSARFYALIGARRTGALKFNRRMYTSSLTRAGSKVNIKGYVTAPLAKKGQTVTIQRRVSCDKFRTVGTSKVGANGKFSVTFGDPPGATAAIYRAQSAVPKYAHSKKDFATYTLPQPLAS